MKFIVFLSLFLYNISFGIEINNFKDLSVGKSWKYISKKSGGNSFEAPVSDSAEFTYSVIRNDLYQDSISFTIDVYSKNIYHRVAGRPDTVLPPDTNRYSCVKRSNQNIVYCKDSLAQYPNRGVPPLFFGHFDFREYLIENSTVANYDSMTLNLYNLVDTFSVNYMKRNYGRYRGNITENYYYMDSIGYVYYRESHLYMDTSGLYPTLVSYGDQTVKLVEYNSSPFDYLSYVQLVPTSIRTSKLIIQNIIEGKYFDIRGRSIILIQKMKNIIWK